MRCSTACIACGQQNPTEAKILEVWLPTALLSAVILTQSPKHRSVHPVCIPNSDDKLSCMTLQILAYGGLA